MKITLGEMQSAVSVLTKIGRHPLSDIKAAYWLHKGLDKINQELKHLNDTRNEMFKKYGTADATTKGEMRIKEEHMEVFVKEMNTLLSTEIDVDFNPVDMSKLSGLSLSAAEFQQIEKFVLVPTEWNLEDKSPAL